MTYRYLLFDADDTLFDFQKAQEKSLQTMIETIALPPSAKDDYRTISHGLWAQLEKNEITLAELKIQRFSRLLALYPQAKIQDGYEVEKIYEAQLASHADLIDGAKDLLENLAKDYILCIVSNGMPNIQHPRLQKSGIAKYFKYVFISEEIGAQKPSTAFFDKVFAVIPAKKEECLVIGDSLTSDIAGGKNYGLDTCYYNKVGKTSPQATYCIAHLEDLYGILKKDSQK